MSCPGSVSDACNLMKGVRGRGDRQDESICHLVNPCVKSAMKIPLLKIDDLLVDMYYYFHTSVKKLVAVRICRHL